MTGETGKNWYQSDPKSKFARSSWKTIEIGEMKKRAGHGRSTCKGEKMVNGDNAADM